MFCLELYGKNEPEMVRINGVIESTKEMAAGDVILSMKLMVYYSQAIYLMANCFSPLTFPFYDIGICYWHVIEY